MTGKISYATFPKNEYVKRLENARQLMAKANLDALVVTDQHNVTYFAGYPYIRQGEGCAILPLEKGPILVSSVAELGNVEKTCWFDDLRYYHYVYDPEAGPEVPDDSAPVIKKTLEELGAKKIGAGPGFEPLREKLNLRTLDASDIIWRLRMVKTDAEVEVFRKICKATCEAIKVSFEALTPGMTERDFLKIVYVNLIDKSGGYPPAFALVRSGPEKSRMVNAVVDHKIINKGELLILDAGTTYQEYPGDTLRMACMGKPNEKQKNFVDLALEAQKAAIDVVKPGIKARDIYNTAKRVFEKAGLRNDAILGYCGHGLGIGGYNPPNLNLSDETPIEEGMVLNIEPQCWDAPYMKSPTLNVVVEDTVVVTKKGFEFLTDPRTRELFVA